MGAGMVEISELIVDGVLAFLLLSVIIVCLIVYRKLSAIKEGQAELRSLVDQLNMAVIEAQRSVSGLKTTAGDAESRLKIECQRAVAVRDELAMMTEAGNNLADRIEKGFTSDKESKEYSPDADKKQQEEILAALREAR